MALVWFWTVDILILPDTETVSRLCGWMIFKFAAEPYFKKQFGHFACNKLLIIIM